jgi:hypothetical protein
MFRATGGRVRPKTLDWAPPRVLHPNGRSQRHAHAIDETEPVIAFLRRCSRSPQRVLEVTDERSLLPNLSDSETKSADWTTILARDARPPRILANAIREDFYVGEPNAALAARGPFDLTIWRRARWPADDALQTLAPLSAFGGELIARFSEPWSKVLRSLLRHGWRVGERSVASSQCQFSATRLRSAQAA